MIIRIGGLPPSTSAGLIIPVLDEIRAKLSGVVGAYPSGQITNKAPIVFRDNQSAWDLMKKMKGIKFELLDGAGVKLKLWHNFDKNPLEQLVSRRTAALVNLVKEHLISNNRATTDIVCEFIGSDLGDGHTWLVHRSAVPTDAPPGTLGRPQNWPLARFARNSAATFARLPGVERVPAFTVAMDVNAIEHGGGTAASMEA